MTGYGRGEATARNVHYTVEVHSVNRKHMDVQMNLPRELTGLEPMIREKLSSAVSRGRLNVVVACAAGAGNGPPARMDHKVAAAYKREISRLARDLKMDDQLSIDALIKLPGVVCKPEEQIGLEESAVPVDRALRGAIGAMLKMREKEGKHLAADVTRRLKALHRQVTKIRKLQPAAVKNHRASLMRRIEEAGVPVDLSDERLIKEVAYFAERSDISEELARIGSHLDQISQTMNGDSPAGRTLEFLVQELSREINTLGAKANDSAIAQCVVAAKSEVEKIKEQVQNIE